MRDDKNCANRRLVHCVTCAMSGACCTNWISPGITKQTSQGQDVCLRPLMTGMIAMTVRFATSCVFGCSDGFHFWDDGRTKAHISMSMPRVLPSSFISCYENAKCRPTVHLYSTFRLIPPLPTVSSRRLLPYSKGTYLHSLFCWPSHGHQQQKKAQIMQLKCVHGNTNKLLPQLNACHNTLGALDPATSQVVWLDQRVVTKVMMKCTHSQNARKQTLSLCWGTRPDEGWVGASDNNKSRLALLLALPWSPTTERTKPKQSKKGPTQNIWCHVHTAFRS